MNNFKYPTNLEVALGDLEWINRNIAARSILDPFLKEGIKWSDIPYKDKTINEYYNYRQNKLIGELKRLTNYERSKVTEEFKNISKEVKALIIPAIESQDYNTMNQILDN